MEPEPADGWLFLAAHTRPAALGPKTGLHDNTKLRGSGYPLLRPSMGIARVAVNFGHRFQVQMQHTISQQSTQPRSDSFFWGGADEARMYTHAIQIACWAEGSIIGRELVED